LTAHFAKRTIVLKGIGVSPGIVSGSVYVITHRIARISRHKLSDKALIREEIIKFSSALESSIKELADIKDKLNDPEGIGPLIIDAHIMILKDEGFIRNTIAHIENEGINAQWALEKTVSRYQEIFKKIEDPYLKERIRDIEDVVQRIFRHLSGIKYDKISDIEEETIIVARDLSPADTIQMKVEKVLGFATDIGGKTSHTTIVARSLGIPAVVGLETITSEVRTDDIIVMDGTSGVVIVNPDQETLKRYEDKKRHHLAMEEDLLSDAFLPAVTKDNYSIGVGANIEFIEEIPSAVLHGANGVGLFRTEFLYVNKERLPTEEEHFLQYKSVIEGDQIKWATIRTFDLGGDKFISDPRLAEEMNPAMGLRAVRYCLRERQSFIIQLRAILRASAYGNTGIMIPMISGVEEIKEVKKIIHEVKQQLISERIPINQQIKLGIMIEVPSAVMMADALAREVDFFSIGTNDLIQYALAIDRVNEHVAYLYRPCHPAVLRLIKQVIDAGHRAGIKVAMCGEMAGDPFCTMILLGLELDGLSMTPLAIPRVKRIIRESTLKEAKELLAQVMNFTRTDEIEPYIKKYMSRRFPQYCVINHE
jgi:phosphotransferase system enzyme I (PtsI)